MNWLFIFLPVALALSYWLPGHQLLVFLSASLAILPLAAWMSEATEALARRTNETIGGLLNATFGNAAEWIIAITALRAGLVEVVQAAIVGSIVGNILLVLGAAMLAGGFRHSIQVFNAEAARSQASMLTLSAIALVLPAAYEALLDKAGQSTAALQPMSLVIAIVLLLVYGLDLFFMLKTHLGMFKSGSEDALESVDPSELQFTLSVQKPSLVLAIATAGVVWMSELLVGAIEPAAAAMGMNTPFIGIFVVAILGNAAEHATAVTAAMGNRMDLALSIAIGSSVQIALFVAPLLVLMSWLIAPVPMDLAFPVGQVIIVLLAVTISAQLANDGRSYWLKGAQLLTIYLIMAITFYCLPATISTVHGS